MNVRRKEVVMKTQEDISRILTTLDQLYPFDGKCFLNYKEPWQLLFATMLSAQCTDSRVNQVTEELYKKYPSIEAFANASLSALEQAVRSTGFFRAKARNIKQSAKKLLYEYGGELPSDINLLIEFSGVGRKTANVVRGHIFNIPSVTVDTHVKRVSFRLGLTKHQDPRRIEFDLMDILPQTHWIRYNQQIITHGRQVCTARNPQCSICKLKKDCEAPMS